MICKQNSIDMDVQIIMLLSFHVYFIKGTIDDYNNAIKEVKEASKVWREVATASIYSQAFFHLIIHCF